MSIQLKTLRALAFFSLFSGLAQATVLFNVTDSLSAADPTQTGRLSRSGIQQDWANDEVFPGVINPATTYFYQTYVVNVGNTPYIQIEVDSLSTDTFVSAYDNAYLPSSAGSPNFGFDTNWLGDAGTSGNFFGTDPVFFQVFVPQNDNLIIVVNQTSPGNGLGSGNPYAIQVEGFVDSNFTDPSSVPEPASIALSSGGLLMLLLGGFARRWRARAS